LERVHIRNNQIQEQKGLETLVNLQELDLTGNSIKKTRKQKDLVKFEAAYFEIDSHKIEWGKSIDKVSDILLDTEKISADRYEAEYKVSQILGFEANKAKITAAQDTCSVCIIEYAIAPLKNINEEKFYMAYINHLEPILGEPAKTELENEITLEELPRRDPQYRQDYAICKVIWYNDDLEITLKVFGETRVSDHGNHAADLEIEWLGEQYDDNEDEEDDDD
jgi:Leucine-rich repeat (LRR) protein